MPAGPGPAAAAPAPLADAGVQPPDVVFEFVEQAQAARRRRLVADVVGRPGEHVDRHQMLPVAARQQPQRDREVLIRGLGGHVSGHAVGRRSSDPAWQAQRQLTQRQMLGRQPSAARQPRR